MVSVLDRGLLLGDGLFETLLVKNERPIWFQEHWARFENSAQYGFFSIPNLATEIHDVIVRLSQDMPGGDGVARITLTRGTGVQGLIIHPKTHVNLCVSIAKPTAPSAPNGIRLGFAPDRRSTGGQEWGHKTLQFMHSVRALHQVQAQGFDDALWLGKGGELLECTTSNLFLVHKGKILTHPTDGSILPGTCRAKVLGLCVKLGIEALESVVFSEILPDCEECFITTSVRGVVSVRGVGELQHFNSAGKILQALKIEILSEFANN